MKKLTILLCLFVLLCGCEAAAKETESVASTESAVGTEIANPMRKVTDAKLIKEYSRGLSQPEGVSEATYYLYNDTLFEIRFEKDGARYNVRTAVSDSFEDISGMYYKWTIEEGLDNIGLEGSAKRYIGENETVDVVAWYDKESKVNYSLSVVAADLDGFDPTAVVRMMIAK